MLALTLLLLIAQCTHFFHLSYVSIYGNVVISAEYLTSDVVEENNTLTGLWQPFTVRHSNKFKKSSLARSVLPPAPVEL